MARSSSDAIALLEHLRGEPIGELWLDRDLHGEDTVWPVRLLPDDAALGGDPFDVGTVSVHASRASPAHKVVISVRRAGYRVARRTEPRQWRHG